MSPENCEEKTFLVTGGASGLGAAYAERFLKEGAKSVAILDISEELGKATADRLEKTYPGKILFIKCDVANEQDIKEAFDAVVKQFQRIDVIVNNAGLMNDSPKVWPKMCDVNYRGLVSFTEKAIEHMRKDKGGSGGTIVNISSTLALIKSHYLPTYCGTKSGVLHFSQSLTVPPFYERTGIRILTKCLGPTDTPLLHNIDQLTFTSADGKTFEEESKPLKNLFQTVEAAVNGFMDMYKNGKPGSVWVCQYNLPAKDITKELEKAYDIMFNIVFEEVALKELGPNILKK